MTDSGARGNKGNIGQLGAHARPDGRPVGPDHRRARAQQLPRGHDRPRVLHLHPRRPQGSRGHRPPHRRLRVPHPAPRGRGAGRHHPRGRLRHRGGELDHPRPSPRTSPTRSSAGSSAGSPRPTCVDPKAKVKKGETAPIVVARNDEITEEVAQAHRRRRHRRGPRPLTAHLRVALRRLPHVLRPQPRHRRAGRHRRGGGHHRRPVDRRARHAADHADVPHRRRRRPGHHAGPAARRGAVRGPHAQGQGRDQPHRRHRRGHRGRHRPQGQGDQPRGVRHAARICRTAPSCWSPRATSSSSTRSSPAPTSGDDVVAPVKGFLAQDRRRPRRPRRGRRRARVRDPAQREAARRGRPGDPCR